MQADLLLCSAQRPLCARHARLPVLASRFWPTGATDVVPAHGGCVPAAGFPGSIQTGSSWAHEVGHQSAVQNSISRIVSVTRRYRNDLFEAPHSTED